MIAMGKIPFATMTHGCKAIINNKYCSLLKNQDQSIFFFTKKGQSHFSFLKVDSQNPKFNKRALPDNRFILGARIYYIGHK